MRYLPFLLAILAILAVSNGMECHEPPNVYSTTSSEKNVAPATVEADQFEKILVKGELPTLSAVALIVALTASVILCSRD